MKSTSNLPSAYHQSASAGGFKSQQNLKQPSNGGEKATTKWFVANKQSHPQAVFQQSEDIADNNSFDNITSSKSSSSQTAASLNHEVTKLDNQANTHLTSKPLVGSSKAKTITSGKYSAALIDDVKTKLESNKNNSITIDDITNTLNANADIKTALIQRLPGSKDKCIAHITLKDGNKIKLSFEISLNCQNVKIEQNITHIEKIKNQYGLKGGGDLSTQFGILLSTNSYYHPDVFQRQVQRTIDAIYQCWDPSELQLCLRQIYEIPGLTELVTHLNSRIQFLAVYFQNNQFSNQFQQQVDFSLQNNLLSQDTLWSQPNNNQFNKNDISSRGGDYTNNINPSQIKGIPERKNLSIEEALNYNRKAESAYAYKTRQTQANEIPNPDLVVGTADKLLPSQAEIAFYTGQARNIQPQRNPDRETAIQNKGSEVLNIKPYKAIEDCGNEYQSEFYRNAFHSLAQKGAESGAGTQIELPALVRPVRGDGNCFWRSALDAIPGSILSQNYDNIYYVLKNYDDEKINDTFKKYGYALDDKNKIISKQELQEIMFQILHYAQDGKLEAAIEYFEEAWIGNDTFDRGMIAFERSQIALIALNHPEVSINGLPLPTAVVVEDELKKDTSLENYIKEKVLKFGEDAQGVLLYLCMMVLWPGSKIFIINLDTSKAARAQNSKVPKWNVQDILYDEKTNFESANNGLRFRHVTQEVNKKLGAIYILRKDGHYDIIASENRINQLKGIGYRFEQSTDLSAGNIQNNPVILPSIPAPTSLTVGNNFNKSGTNLASKTDASVASQHNLKLKQYVSPIYQKQSEHYAGSADPIPNSQKERKSINKDMFKEVIEDNSSGYPSNGNYRDQANHQIVVSNPPTDDQKKLAEDRKTMIAVLDTTIKSLTKRTSFFRGNTTKQQTKLNALKEYQRQLTNMQELSGEKLLEMHKQIKTATSEKRARFFKIGSTASSPNDWGAPRSFKHYVTGTAKLSFLPKPSWIKN